MTGHAHPQTCEHHLTFPPGRFVSSTEVSRAVSETSAATCTAGNELKRFQSPQGVNYDSSNPSASVSTHGAAVIVFMGRNGPSSSYTSSNCLSGGSCAAWRHRGVLSLRSPVRVDLPPAESAAAHRPGGGTVAVGGISTECSLNAQQDVGSDQIIGRGSKGRTEGKTLGRHTEEEGNNGKDGWRGRGGSKGGKEKDKKRK
ncbi:hypothetical protein EYF80_025854 [Liparis tanakae]|uniref:Uncharacterized protein n=1 Tax=Liparis tanakae TaxID=230148 RepID=A0A4Z2HE85_9TELE|nr:hypothetical protein EYF80_025854 [Liparis tanakae]